MSGVAAIWAARIAASRARSSFSLSINPSANCSAASTAARLRLSIKYPHSRRQHAHAKSLSFRRLRRRRAMHHARNRPTDFAARHLFSFIGSPAHQLRNDRLGIVHTTAPDAAAGVLEGGPEARIGREGWVGGEVGSRVAAKQFGTSPIRPVVTICVADEINRPFQLVAVDHNANEIAIAEFAE